MDLRRFRLDARAAREDRRWTQGEVARRVGVNRNTIHRWEKGLTTPDTKTLVALADVLGLHFGDYDDAQVVTRPVHPSPQTDGPQEDPAMPDDARARLARFVSEMLPDVAALIEREVHELYGRRLLSDGSPAKKKEGH